jgi:hypothetical protein
MILETENAISPLPAAGSNQEVQRANVWIASRLALFAMTKARAST